MKIKLQKIAEKLEQISNDLTWCMFYHQDDAFDFLKNKSDKEIIDFIRSTFLESFINSAQRTSGLLGILSRKNAKIDREKYY